MPANLATTNVLLGIMAAVSLLQAVSVIGVFIAGALVFRRLMQVIGALEERQVAPAMERVNAILDDVKNVTSTVRQETACADRAVHRVSEAVSRWGARRGAGGRTTTA